MSIKDVSSALDPVLSSLGFSFFFFLLYFSEKLKKSILKNKDESGDGDNEVEVFDYIPTTYERGFYLKPKKNSPFSKHFFPISKTKRHGNGCQYLG